jgi:hypothetical protein
MIISIGLKKQVVKKPFFSQFPEMYFFYVEIGRELLKRIRFSAYKNIQDNAFNRRMVVEIFPIYKDIF